MEFPPNKQVLHALLKGLIGADVALLLLSIPLGIFEGMVTESMLNEIGKTTNFTDTEQLTAAIWIMILVVLLPAAIASWIGLFRLKNWARWVYLAAICSVFLLSIPMGCFQYDVCWGLSQAILDLEGPIKGLILGIVFLSPLAVEFRTETEESGNQQHQT